MAGLRRSRPYLLVHKLRSDPRRPSVGGGCKTAARPQVSGEANPKIDPVPNSNTEKEPNDWVSRNNPMTGAQASCLKTLSDECGEPDSFQPGLTKAEASKRIDALKAKRRPVQHR